MSEELAVRDDSRYKPIEVVRKVVTADNVQKWSNVLLGTKKNGSPRAVYDVVKDCYLKPKKHKKKKHKKKKNVQPSMYDLYIGVGKKKKKKHKKRKHAHYPF